MKITETERMRMALLLIDEAAAHASMFAKTERETKSFNEIYRLAHAGSAPSCRRNHGEWIKPIDSAIRAEKRRKP